MNDQTFHTPSFGDEEFDIPLMHTTTAHQVDNFQMPINMNLLSNDASSFNQWNQTMTQETQLVTHNTPHYDIDASNHSNYQQQIMMLQQGNNSSQTQNRNSSYTGRSPTPLEANGSSDDSEDNINSLKRPDVFKTGSPQSTKAVPNKKVKPVKKKKKKDPNEPQKPVSAYALFFRDTQAAIKGQNPNASFGEVSKIVASMWDVLAPEHKNVYKKKTEAAKKEYLKLLAAYRASLVSQGNEPELQSPQTKPMNQFLNQQQGPPKIFSPSSQQQMMQPNQHQNNYHPQQPLPPMSTHIPQQHQNYQQVPTNYPPGFNKSPQQPAMQMNQMSQMIHHQQQQQTIQAMNGMVNMAQSPQQQFINQQQINVSEQQMMNPQQPQQFHNQQLPDAPLQSSTMQTMQPIQYCINTGQNCQNVSVASSDWEDEYCSNECVIAHCRDVFGNWVHNNRSNNPQQTFSAVK